MSRALCVPSCTFLHTGPHRDEGCSGEGHGCGSASRRGEHDSSFLFDPVSSVRIAVGGGPRVWFGFASFQGTSAVTG